MKRLSRVLGAIAIVGLVVVGAAHAERPRGFEGSGHWGAGGFGVLLRGAGLTEAQEAQVRQIVANHRAEFQRLGGELRAARAALDAKLYGTDPVAAVDLVPLVEQIGRLRGELTQQSMQVALEIRGILTPEQLARAAQMRQRLAELRTEMRSLLGGRR